MLGGIILYDINLLQNLHRMLLLIQETRESEYFYRN